MNKPFVTEVRVGEDEAEYVSRALVSERILRRDQRFEWGQSFTMGESILCIVGDEPLTLAQRKFLIGCGLRFGYSHYEE